MKNKPTDNCESFPRRHENGWISVWNRLPENNQEVLMSYNNFVIQGKFANSKFYYPSICAHILPYCRCDEQEGITHWMPLPEPPN